MGGAQGAYEAAVKYAKERQQFDKPIADFQAIQFKLADMATQIECARLLTLQAAAMKDAGAVYLHAIGGAAQVYARSVDKVLGVHLLEFGIPEAMWHLKVKNFLAIVTMDAHGHSLHAEMEKTTGAALAALRDR